MDDYRDLIKVMCAVAEQRDSPMMAFDLLIEAADAINELTAELELSEADEHAAISVIAEMRKAILD